MGKKDDTLELVLQWPFWGLSSTSWRRMPEELLKGLEGVAVAQKGGEKISVCFKCEVHNPTSPSGTGGRSAPPAGYGTRNRHSG